MGVVWAAVNEQTSREVALKLILSANDHLRQRLIREARACGQLSHRNIIEVLDAGETDAGDPYLVMPLLVGETLEDLLERRHKLEPPLVAQIGRDVARALTAAHAASIVHRDLKPANIFLHREAGTEGVVVKVVDFGICKRLEAQDMDLTTAGKVVGSPSYMSPEQLNPENGIDHRTDIWSLGVVMFEMLAGVRPFQGERVNVILSVMNAKIEIPSLSQLVRFVPPGLADIVASCLVRDRNQRIGTAEELADRLHTFASAGDVMRVSGAPIERKSTPPQTDLTRERAAEHTRQRWLEAQRESTGSRPGNTRHVDPSTDVSELPTVPLMAEHLERPGLRQPPPLPPPLPARPRSVHSSPGFEPTHNRAVLEGERARSSDAPHAPSPSKAVISAPISIHPFTPTGLHSRAIAGGNGAAPEARSASAPEAAFFQAQPHQRRWPIQPRMVMAIVAAAGTVLIAFAGLFLFSARKAPSVASTSNFQVIPSQLMSPRPEPPPVEQDLKPAEPPPKAVRSRKPTSRPTSTPPSSNRVASNPTSTSIAPQPKKNLLNPPGTAPRRCRVIKCKP